MKRASPFLKNTLTKKKIFIAGAGPSGLATALFLNQQGIDCTIVDKKNDISLYSKALGVNPRTLELLEPLHLTKTFLERGRRMDRINLWYNDTLLFVNNLNRIKHKYPFMLMLSQHESEQILSEACLKKGINLHYGVPFESFKMEANSKGVYVDAGNHSGKFDFLIGADGAGSKVRDQAGIEMDGFSYSNEWKLYDIELEMDLNADEGHIRIFPKGAMIMLRITENLWRLAGNFHDLLDHLPNGTQMGQIKWESAFHIHHKMASKLTAESVGIIGDAAHLHSPVGARGMNLGIEDAFTIAQLIHDDRFHDFDKIRRTYLKKTVNRINTMTMTLAGNGASSRFMRRQLPWIKYVFPLLMPQARKFIMGLN